MHNQVITHQLQVSGALLFTHAYAVFGLTGRSCRAPPSRCRYLHIPMCAPLLLILLRKDREA